MPNTIQPREHSRGSGTDGILYTRTRTTTSGCSTSNTTATNPILIIGYVVGDKATFELYGTKDGRTSVVVGPKKLTETLPGEPVYIETTDLAPGVIKQVETPHPGGSAVATYIVSYADGTKKTMEFKSWYRRWPAKYLKGVAVLSSPSPTP